MLERKLSFDVFYVTITVYVKTYNIDIMKKYSARTKRFMIRLYDSLSEKDQRHYAAVEAEKLGHGGINYIADLFGCCRQTVAVGLDELKKTICPPQKESEDLVEEEWLLN